MLAALAGALLATGVLVLVKGVFPGKTSLNARLAEFADDAEDLFQQEDSLLQVYSLMLLETVKGEDIERYESDVLVTGSDLPGIAVEKVKSAGLGAGVIAALAILFGWVSNPLGLLIAIVVGAAAGYLYPDMELKKKAVARRVEFSRALTAYMTLLGSSISGGGGLATALSDAAAMGDGWVFDHIRGALEVSRLDGTSPWVALDRLGQRLNVVPLIELAGSLTLAGNSGARVTETLAARAQSSREKELSEVRSEAEAKSAKLGIPVGMVMLTWVFFVGYPAITGISGF